MTPHPVPEDTGWIEVITGCMFSGKTEELIRRLRRAKIARLEVKIFKPALDNRYSDEEIVSHDLHSIPSLTIEKAEEILKLSAGANVVGIDEAQFFDSSIVEICNKLADQGKRVIVAGLDQDYRGEPFEPMPKLLAIAEYVTKTLAICTVCGNPADRTQRKTTNKSRVLVGAADLYEARCRKCHYIPEE